MPTEMLEIPPFRALKEWPNKWKVGENQRVDTFLDANKGLKLTKSKNFTLHVTLNADAKDMKKVKAGRGVPLNGNRAFGILMQAESASVTAQLVVHEFSAPGQRLARHVVSNNVESIYVANEETDKLVLSIRLKGEGVVDLRRLDFLPVPMFEGLAAGVHTLSDSLTVRDSRPLADPLPQGVPPSGRSFGSPSDLSFGSSLGFSAPYWGVGPEFEYATRIRQVPGTYETIALRLKSVTMRDAFARNATNMQFNYAQLVRVLQVMRGGKLPGAAAAVKQWDVKGLLVLARILANQQIKSTDLMHSELLFNVVNKVFGSDAFGRTDNLVFVEALSGLDRWKEARQMSKKLRAFRGQPIQSLLFDANFALKTKGDASEASWLTIINGMYAREGFDEVEFTEGGRSRLDRIRGVSEARSVDGPEVSVIVPTFEGADLIETTLDSLVGQTWKNLQIIVVDDGSSPATQERLRNICSRYDGVELILQEQNLGAYLARNVGLEQSTGDFVTVHDDDDWSHPQKIQFQVSHLMENPHLLGNMSRHARSTEELETTRINNNPLFSQANFSSLLVRRDVFDVIGPWDQVNRGADAEFRDRLLTIESGEVAVIGDAPLSFTRTRTASLTAGELGRGYVDPARLFYVSAYQRAHADGRLHDFPRPSNMLPGMRNQDLGKFDVVFATDFRFPGGTTHLTVNEIERASSQGLRVGLLQMGSSVNGTRQPIHVRALDAAKAENVEVLSPKDRFVTDLLIVRHPTVLQYSDNLDVNFTARRTAVIVNHPPVLTGGTGFVYDLHDCRANAESLFGEEVTFYAESGVTRDLVHAVQRDFALCDELWPGFVSMRTATAKQVDPSRKPVMGRHSRDSLVKWPDQASDIRRIYMPKGHGVETRILGGIGSLPAASQESLRMGADVLEFNEVPVPDFLDTLDFWVYFHSSSLTESFGMSTVEAMLSGAVVILPKYMEKNFGDGALYCDGAEVQDLIKRLWADPEAYRAQSEAGIRKATELYSDRAFDMRLARQIQLSQEGPKEPSTS